MMDEFQFNQFAEKLKSIEIVPTPAQIDQFQNYYHLLVEWNRKINLTAITELSDVILKHFLDSVIISRYVDLSKIHSCIDIGTGAGFPGIPLAILYPEIQFTLLDSLNKRITFLNEVIHALNLTNVHAFHGRAEEYAGKEMFRESFDLCVSRAVSKLSVLAEYCIPYIKKDGLFVSYKAEHVEDELADSKHAISLLGGKVVKVPSFSLFDSDFHRTFVIIKKINNTPKKYPRSSGIPAKKPLV